MSSVDRLAQMIAEMHKTNRNPPSTAPRVGEVTGVSPLQIKWGDHIILNSDKLFVSKGLVFALGDKVILQPDEHFKMFFVMSILS